VLQVKKLVKVDFVWVDSTTIAVHRHGSGALKKKEISLLDEEGKD